MIYLDVASTTKPKQEVIEAMMPYLIGDRWYNPSSLYYPATQVKKDIDKARKIVAKFIGAKTNEIFFTSGGSESNCWAIKGFVDNSWGNYIPAIITTTIEHKSIMSCVDNLPYVEVSHVNVDKDGFAKLYELQDYLLEKENKKKKCLVSIQLANNEIGVVQNIKKISDIVHSHNAILHVDAVQAFGQIPINVKELGIDMMSISGHKLGTPKGVGVLYKKKNVDIAPLIYGSQMDSLRGGTENVPYIIGMAKAVELSKEKIKHQSSMVLMRDYFVDKLESIGCKLVGDKERRLPNNISIMLPVHVGGEEMLHMLDMCDIMCSTGSACNSHSKLPSHVLKAIGLTDEEAGRVVRLTFDSDLTFEDVDVVITEMEKQIKLLRDEAF